MAKRRAKGAGSVYKVKGRGYIAQREVTPDGDKRRYERRTYSNKADALRQIADWQTEARALAAHHEAGNTVQSWLTHWLTTKERGVKPSTYEFYERHLAYVVPHLGAVRLLDVTAQQCRSALGVLGDDLAPRSCAHIHTVLRQAFQLAVDDGILTKNPMDTVEKPKVTKYRAYALNTTERAAFLAQADTTRLRAMWRLLIDFGPRHDEILDRRWSDYSAENKTLRIQDTKNDRVRFLPLQPEHIALLQAHWKQLQIERSDNPHWKEHGYLFPSEVGTKLGQSNIRRAFKRLLELANLPHTIRVHDLRHTAATDMLTSGMDIPTVQYITGHRDSAVLLEIYAHTHQDRNRSAMEQVEVRRKSGS